MKPVMYAALTLAIGSTILCATSSTAVKADDAKVTATNLSAQLSLDNTAYPHVAAGNSPSTLQATYTVANPTNQPIAYLQGGLGVDWKIVDDHGQVVYDVNKGKLSPHFMFRRVLQPGQHQDFHQSIALRTQTGAPLASGKYALQACLVTTNSLQTTKDFTVK